MHFNTKDPDLETINRRIQRGIIDLQPDFQRGEVWSKVKKQRLIDSILRGWHVPPIHLVEADPGKFDVLDGQQRLSAIRDFMNDQFQIDGLIEPHSDSIAMLHGLKYSTLPSIVKSRFDGHSIRVFELTDYDPSEPYELFFRLNQPTALTEAEKRNALIGDARNQVRALVGRAGALGLEAPKVGFSNSRMAYDELVSRVLLTLEQGNLVEKITSARITQRYRSQRPFREDVVSLALDSFAVVLQAPVFADDYSGSAKPNKATFYTWLCLAARAIRSKVHPEELYNLITFVEENRFPAERHAPHEVSLLLDIFHDRSTSRVADVSSVVLRDMTAWMIMDAVGTSTTGLDQLIARAWRILRERHAADDLASYSVDVHWGGGQWI